jgi:pimeloyl-ACP methyl ester carboxylesterase
VTSLWLKLSVLCVALGACSQRGGSTNDGGARGSNVEQPDATAPDPELVRFATADGWTIVGDLRLRRRRGAAVLFVHQLSSNRGEWARFASRVAGPAEDSDRGRSRPSTLAVDLRGHGESTANGDGTLRWTAFGNDRARWMGLEHDVAAAVDYLRQRVGTTQIVIVASGIGATAASLYAARSGAPVVGLVLISPASEARGIQLAPPLLQALRARKRVLLIAASGDTSAADTVRDVQQQASGDDGGGLLLEVERYDNASAHGVTLGAEGVHPEMWARIERFIADT